LPPELARQILPLISAFANSATQGAGIFKILRQTGIGMSSKIGSLSFNRTLSFPLWMYLICNTCDSNDGVSLKEAAFVFNLWINERRSS
jgi:hypothetical protein